MMFASGAAALIYEVVWTKLLALHAGADPATLAAVLLGFLGGLAVGGWMVSGTAASTPRPLRLLALLEGIAALMGAASTWIFPAAVRLLDELAGPLPPEQPEGPGVKILAGVLVALPAALMGASLPLAVRAAQSGPGEGGRRAALLYGWNTLGGACGAALAGFTLLPILGLPVTLGFAAGAQAMVALTAAALAARGGKTPPEEGARGAWPGNPLRLRGAPLDLVAAVAIAGVAALAAEVAWTLLFHAAFGSSTYALSVVLTAYLIGIGAGSFLPAGRLDRLAAPAAVFGALQLGVTASLLLLVGVLPRLPGWMGPMSARWSGSPFALYVSEGAMAAFLLLPATLLMGAAFPVACRALYPEGRISSAVGIGSALSLLGGALGILAGRRWVESFGLRQTLLLAAALHSAAALCALARRFRSLPRRAATGVAAALATAALATAALAASAPWDRDLLASGSYLHGPLLSAATAIGGLAPPQRGRLRYYRESSAGVVSVREGIDGTLSLAVNGRTEASSGADSAAQLWIGHLPPLLFPEARNALLVGLAGGFTLGALAQHPLERIDCVELVGAVAEASREFDSHTGAPLRDPRVRLHLTDARRFLRRHTGPYDLIVSQPSNPWVAGMSALFSREFFELGRSRLSGSGLMAVWLQAYAIDPDDFKSMVATFMEVFPSASLWEEAVAGGDYFLVASADGRPPAWDRVAGALRRPGALRQLVPLGVSELGDLLAHRVAAAAPLFEKVRSAGRITDANLRLEFTTPLHLRRRSVPEIVSLLSEAHPRRIDLDLSSLRTAVRERTLRRLAALDRLRSQDIEVLRMLEAEGDLLAADPRLHHAAALIASGWFEAGAGELETLLESEPGGALAWLLLGAARLARSSPDLAEPARLALQRATQLRSGDATAWNLLGRAHLELRELEAARDCFDRALALRPGFVEALNNRGALRLALGRLQDALTDLEKAAELGPASAQVRVNLGLALRRLGRPGDSRRAYEQGLAIDPELPDLHFNLATLLLAEGRHAEALRHYDQAVRLSGEDAPAERGRALALLGLGRASEARIHLERSLQLDPEQPDLLHALKGLRGGREEGVR